MWARGAGMHFRVYTDETRPLLQGARLSAYEMVEAGMETTVLCDNMAASLMQSGAVQAVFVGCDRVARNGDTANKIGTLGVGHPGQALFPALLRMRALLHHRYGLPHGRGHRN